MPTATAPASGNYIESGGLYYTNQEWQQLHPPAGTGDSSQVIDGKAYVASYLASLGLPSSMSNDAWTQYSNSGQNSDYLANWVTTTPAFQNQYPDYPQLRSQGYSVTDMVNFNQQAATLGQKYGIPAGFLTPARTSELMASGWDTTELDHELQNYAVALAHPEIQARLASVDGQNALTPGGLAALFTDGSKAQPLLDQQFNAAAIGGASDRYGVGVSQAEANQLALNNGVTANQADAAFAQVGAAKPLLDALPGEAGGNITSDTAAAAIVGKDPVAQAALTLQQQKRQAQFSGGGGYQQSSTGLAGAGSASNQ